MKNDKTVYFIILIFAFLVLGGFFVVLNQISGLSSQVKDNELNLQLISKNAGLITTPPATSTASVSQNNESTSTQNQNNNPLPVSNDIVVPTGIIFTASSSASLQPQTSVTITIESVTKKSDGTAVVSLKAFTDQASGYSAIDPASFIQYVSLDYENQKPTNISPVFASMPPKSATSGTVTFHIDPAKNMMIIQTGQGDNPKYYEINFTNETYKETIIG
ncbi:MAG: hypothetical protein ABSE68_01985 [Minisyncoccia bacterium]